MRHQEYPGINKMQNKLVFRTATSHCVDMQFGMGFLHKGGVSVDEYNRAYPYYALVYVIRGEGEYIAENGEVFRLGPGSVFQRLPGVTHSTILNPSSRWAECFIDFDVKLYEVLADWGVICKDEYVYSISPDRSVEEDFFSLMERTDSVSDGEFSFIVPNIISFVSLLLQRCRAHDVSDLDRFIDEVCGDFYRKIDTRFDLHDYCKGKGVGYEKFRKLFREKTGVSPKQYIIRRRIDAASRLLLTGKKSIGEIAAELGYNTPYEFSAQFRKFTGISPKKYRQQQ